MKQCSKCKIEKPLDQFSKDSSRKDGKQLHCKECNRIAGEKYRSENPEKRRAMCASWDARNKDRKKEHKRRYISRHPEKIAEQWARYRENNLERLKKYQQENQESRRANEATRRARKVKAGGTHSGDDIKELLRLQRGKCACCRDDIRKKSHADHIVPLARGGSNDRSNIQLLCPTCNRKKHAKDPIDWMQSRGYLL